jgi:hypothetical protein
MAIWSPAVPFSTGRANTAINKLPIRGGAVTVLDTTPLTRPATGLHLIGPNLIYAVVRIVYHVPADGSAITPLNLRVVFTVATGVVSCAPWVGSIFLADRNGAIVWHSDSGSGEVKQQPGAAFITVHPANFLHSHGRLDW